jgi:hypothetical protein
MILGVTRPKPIKSLLALALLAASSQAFPQESWSDSVPRVMKIVKNCPLKVRDKNGEWANYKDTFPVGRTVIGAINPRRPDLVFFQLSRDSKFMFLAPRSCFDGEENWNEVAEEEKLGGNIPPRDSHASLLLSIDTYTPAKPASPVLGFCAGGSGEWRSDQWFWGASACAGMRRTKVNMLENGLTFSDSANLLRFQAAATTYYDFLSLPYALGAELFAGLNRTRDGAKTGFDFDPGLAAAWRFYWGSATVTPKFVFHDFRPNRIGFDLQIAYLFGGR